MSRWRICYGYRLREEGWTVLHPYCTWEDDPVPPTYPTFHYFTACPGTAYPDVISATSIVTALGPCACLNFVFWNLTWDTTIGPWGGWKGTETGCSGGAVSISFWPVAAITGGMTWKVRVDYVGGFSEKPYDLACGQGLDAVLIVNRAGGCPRTELTIYLSWPGSLP